MPGNPAENRESRRDATRTFRYPLPVRLSIVFITLNEAANLARTLASLAPLRASSEIVVVDSCSTDNTVAIAKSFGARVFAEPWQGFATQKNSAIAKATGDWILSLDADEELSPGLAEAILRILQLDSAADARTRAITGFRIPRKNFFMGRWMQHGGLFPDPKLRLFRRGTAEFEPRAVHEDLQLRGASADLATFTGARDEDASLLHHAYPTLSSYIEHMNRYSTLGAQMRLEQHRRASLLDLTLRPLATFFYNYILRLGFLDGREGLYQHLGHAIYVWWKYAKVWEQQ